MTRARHRKLVIRSDAHIPIHSEERLAAAFAACRGADHVVIIGDWLDAYPVMSHLKNPAFSGTLQDEINVARALLAELRRIVGPKCRIDYIEGNHEDRIRRFLWKYPGLHGLDALTVPSLLGLSDFNITYHPQSGFVEYGVRFKHGSVVRPQAGYAARAEMLRHRSSGFSGHTHRMGMTMQTDAEGRITEWWEVGHLLDESKAEYVAAADWQPGFLVVEIRDDGSLHATPVRL